MGKNVFTVDYASSVFADKTNKAGTNRFSWRSQIIFSENKHVIEDKNILDLACNTGRMAFPCLELGAKSVTGVEARPELIEAGQRLMAKTAHADKMEYTQSDLFEYLESLEPGQFDTILCLGFLYHTVRQVDFFRQIHRLRPEHFVMDTGVAKNYFWFGRKMFGKPPALFVADYEDPAETRNTTDVDGLVFWPSTSFLEDMTKKIGYRCKRLDYKGVKDWSDMSDYRKGIRASYIATKIKDN